MIATFVVSRFEQVLQGRVAVAFFVPGIVYLADAIGTQTEAIAVRGLSLSHMPIRRLLAGELWTGTLIGLCLGVLAFPAIYLTFHDTRLAWAVAASITCAGMVATSVELLFPWSWPAAARTPLWAQARSPRSSRMCWSLLIYFTIVQLVAH